MAISSVRDSLRPFQLPAYAFLVATIVFQIVDLVYTTLPMRPMAVMWRFQAFGSLSLQGGNLLLLLFLIQLVAMLLSDRTALAALTAGNTFLVVLMVLCTGAFTLDALQLRGRVDPQVVSKFDMTMVTTIVKFLVQGGLSGFFAYSAWRTFNSLKRDAYRGDRVGEDYLVVRTADRVI